MPKGILKRGAKRGDIIGSFTRDVAMYIATSLKAVPEKSPYAHGFWSPSQYIVAYYPEGSVSESRICAKHGYKDSNKDHYYESAGASAEDSELLYRRHRCGCNLCIESEKGASENCLLKHIMGSLKRCTILKKAASTITEDAVRGSALEDYASKYLPFGKGELENVVVVRATKSDQEKYNTSYFLAKISSKAWHLDKEVGDLEPGFLVCKYTWFDLKETLKNGATQYVLADKVNEAPLNINHIVRNLRGTIRFEAVTSGVYLLSMAMHERIIKYGTLSS